MNYKYFLNYYRMINVIQIIELKFTRIIFKLFVASDKILISYKIKYLDQR